MTSECIKSYEGNTEGDGVVHESRGSLTLWEYGKLFTKLIVLYSIWKRNLDSLYILSVIRSSTFNIDVYNQNYDHSSSNARNFLPPKPSCFTVPLLVSFNFQLINFKRENEFVIFATFYPSLLYQPNIINLFHQPNCYPSHLPFQF